ncbi:MAG: hypothetical protein KGZ96_09180, partial [Clostridia bacterium]|nr:hypothetical protein [Clostridia bacterium]
MQENKVNSTRIKIFVFVAVFLVGVNLLISATFHNMSQSFYTYEGEFEYHEVREKGIIFLDDLSRELVVNIKDNTSNKVSFSQEFDMSYQDRKIQVTSRNFQEEGFVVIYGENEIYVEEIIVVGEEIERTHGDIYD